MRSQAIEETVLKTLKVLKATLFGAVNCEWYSMALSRLQGNSPGTKKMRLALALSKLGALLAMTGMFTGPNTFGLGRDFRRKHMKTYQNSKNEAFTRLEQMPRHVGQKTRHGTRYGRG